MLTSTRRWGLLSFVRVSFVTFAFVSGMIFILRIGFLFDSVMLLCIEADGGYAVFKDSIVNAILIYCDSRLR